jgi:hypothetical protein
MREQGRRKPIMKPAVAEITIGRLFNLGQYEHVRYEIKVSALDGSGVADTIRALERVLAGIKPKSPRRTMSRTQRKRS